MTGHFLLRKTARRMVALDSFPRHRIPYQNGLTLRASNMQPLPNSYHGATVPLHHFSLIVYDFSTLLRLSFFQV